MQAKATLFYGFFLILPPAEQRPRLEAALRRLYPGFPGDVAGMPVQAIATELLPRYLRVVKVAFAGVVEVPPDETSLGFAGAAIVILQDLIAVSGQMAKINRMPAYDPRPSEEARLAFARLGIPGSDISWWLVPTLCSDDDALQPQPAETLPLRDP